MLTRVKSGLIMAPLLVLLFVGGYFLQAGAFVLTIFALREFADAFGQSRPSMWVLYASAALLYGGYALGGLFSVPRSSLIIVWVFVSVIMCFLSMFNLKSRDLMSGFATAFAVFYIIWLLFNIVLVDAVTEGSPSRLLVADGFYMTGLHSYVWIVVLAAFGTDIFAYFTGVLLGSHKLCPSISPKKTVEGSIGGVLGSVVLCGLFGLFFLKSAFADCVALGLLGGVISQIGDLSASALKRRIGIKDWGNLIPGHGGVLDRIDSVLFTAPMVFCYLMTKTAFITAV